MSDTDSFIDEVSDELRRDRLYKRMRKYGWIPILLVVLLVGGATFNEWSKARATQAAQALGSEILAALQLEDPAARLAALDAISTDGDRRALVRLLSSGNALEAGDRDEAILALSTVAADVTLSVGYRHLAELKLLLIQGDELPAAERQSRLAPLAAPGAPYRLLAEEQLAIVEVAQGNTDAAVQMLLAILADGEVTAGLRRRVSQLIVALGGELAPA